MRAIIRCNSNATREQWEDVLKHCAWVSNLPQTDSHVVNQKDEILALVADEDRPVVKGTYWFMIHNSDVGSWGLVNSPHEHVVEFRIRNHASAQLRKACEHFVSAIKAYTPKAGAPAGLKFEFSEVIEVLEANSQHLAFYGEVLPREKWKLARVERRQEWALAMWFLIAAIALTILTTPPVEAWTMAQLQDSWREWLDGNLGRFGTSVLVAALVSSFSVLTHYFELRRDGAVRWLLKAT